MEPLAARIHYGKRNIVDEWPYANGYLEDHLLDMACALVREVPQHVSSGTLGFSNERTTFFGE